MALPVERVQRAPGMAAAKARVERWAQAGLSEPTSTSAGAPSSPRRSASMSKACSARSSRGTVGDASRRACHAGVPCMSSISASV